MSTAVNTAPTFVPISAPPEKREIALELTKLRKANEELEKNFQALVQQLQPITIMTPGKNIEPQTSPETNTLTNIGHKIALEHAKVLGLNAEIIELTKNIQL